MINKNQKFGKVICGAMMRRLRQDAQVDKQLLDDPLNNLSLPVSDVAVLPGTARVVRE